jgi:integrase
MTAGNITRRGAHSWRLKFEAGERDPTTGKRQTRFVTVRGTKREAQRELIRLLAEVGAGTAVAPDKVTVGEYVAAWIANHTGLAAKTRERYGQLADKQIIPHLGTILLQKLRPQHIADWHTTLLQRGGTKGGPLSARTVRDCGALLRTILQTAARLEAIGRNVALSVRPPKNVAAEVEILTAEQIDTVLDALGDHELQPIVVLALATGMRRGEIAALAWGNVDLDKGTVRVERSAEQTAAGVNFKAPKTRAGLRTISLPASAVAMLREHHVRQAEQRLLLGLGRPGATNLVFTRADAEPWPPNEISRHWYELTRRYNLPRVAFHALRHTHASALIAAGLDIVSISKRLGHASPTITLNVYAHKFHTNDDAAARAIEAAMRLR